MFNFSIIAAVANNNVIGCTKSNDLLWKIPADLRHFKEQTVGKTVIMGSNTFRSIGKPLPNRRNVVISRSIQEFAGCERYSSLIEALEKEPGELVVMGGGEIYKQAVDLLPAKFDVTIVNLNPVGDVLFPMDVSNFDDESFFLLSDYFRCMAVYNKSLAEDWQFENNINFKFIEYVRD